MEYFICVIGMVMIMEGLPYFAFPDRMKVWVTKILEMQESALRRMGFLLMCFGLFLVYVAKG
ncbi:MAG: DUF2065 domain-containing protein [Desulfobacteraceae bacterium]|nr:MAG: DUF2065 domain-containing protein [Desulfobacteraceae bacterium]